MKRVLFAVLILILAMVACSPPAEVPQVTAPAGEQTARDLQEGKPFRFVHVNRQHPIVRLMALGYFEACEKYDVECVDMGVDGVDIPGWIAKGEASITLGSSGIVFGHDKPTYEVGKKIVEAGIPQVAIHIQLKNNEIPGLNGWVATDNVDYAIRSAERMGELISCKGTVQITQGSYNDTENPVSEAFTKKMNEICPDVIVLDPKEEGFDSPQAIAKIVAILRGNPEIVAAYSTTGAGAYNWAMAAQEIGYKAGQIKIAGMDYSRQNLDLVASGWVDFLVGQPLYEETYKAVECLVGELQGNPCPFENPFPAPLVDKTNMDMYFGFCDRAEKLILE